MSILLVDGQNQPLNGTLTTLLAMALGGFIILPYMGLRRSENAKKYRTNIFVRIFESKLLVILLMVLTIGCIAFGLKFGYTSAFLHEFRSNQFIHIMTIDFFVVSFSFPELIADDLKRRNMNQKNQCQFYSRLCFVPLMGPLIYLYQRKPLQELKQR